MREERRRHLAYDVQRLLQKGCSQREVARRLGIARKTVRKLLAALERRRLTGEDAVERERGATRAPKASKLDPHVDRIRDWLTKWPKLTAVRCLEKLKAEVGFDGGYTIVRERLKALKAEAGLPAPRVPAVPFETAPGQRVEFDWSPYTLDGGAKVQLWNATLRWSRAPSLAACDNYRQTTTLRQLRQAFELWGGVPAEALTDSMPGVVDRWECDAPVLNARYVDFAAYYGFTALIAPRRCPEWKAIAERLFRHHEENLLNGRTVRTVEEYVELLAWWQEEKALGKAHPETGRPVQDMLALERPRLQPLPARPYDTRDVCVRVVDRYQRVQLDTNHYPVPAPVGTCVYLCADTERVVVCDAKARRLIEHERLPAGARVKLPTKSGRRSRYDLDELSAQLAVWGEAAESFAQGLRSHRRYAGPQLTRLLQLQVTWSRDDLVEAMARAVTYRCYDVSRVERILEIHYTPRRLEDLIADSTRERIQQVMRDHPVRQRSLDSYPVLRHGDRLSGPPPASDDGEDA